MGFKWVSVVALVIAFLFLPFWPWSHGEWWPVVVGFCVLLAGAAFLGGFFGKSGSGIWKGKGRG
ncbi:MAG: hypothetical protein JOY54_01260 [Acidobacteriaceae bacterium]|nr:hypothetical protein [Acidobacteriaceae bacterium]